MLHFYFSFNNVSKNVIYMVYLYAHLYVYTYVFFSIQVLHVLLLINASFLLFSSVYEYIHVVFIGKQHSLKAFTDLSISNNYHIHGLFLQNRQS